jgi:crotonobetainyl-CoA:carnitine CoA-transferase CaiB-like acyl-CoA transferase
MRKWELFLKEPLTLRRKSMPDNGLPFENCRILDLTEDGRMICSKMLADLGADVIQIEPPGGSVSGRIGPFYGEKPDPEKSLFWFALNTNKRGITLDLNAPEGRELFKELAASASVIVESFKPGHMKSLSLDYNELVKINPSIIVTSISDFGQAGPYKDHKGSDLVLMAISGYLYLCGDEDRPPIRMGLPLAYLHAGAEAAAATSMAYYHLELTGEGQHVDVSAQESLMWLSMQTQMYWDVAKINPRRVGPCWITAATGNRSILNWECKDGYITHLVMGGAEAKRARVLVDYMKSENMAPEFLEDLDWENFFDINVLTQEDIDLVSGPIGNFFKKHTKTELFQEAVKREIMLFPVSNVQDLLTDEQLSHRKFWMDVDHDELDEVFKYPGPFAKFSETHLQKPTKAPRIGEHNHEVFVGEMGLSSEQLETYKKSGVI